MGQHTAALQHCGQHLDLRGPGEVVALQRAGQPGEVLEAADLGRHVLVIAAVLRYLHHTVLYCTVLYCTVLGRLTLIFHWLVELSPTVMLTVAVSVSVGLRSR